MKQLQINELGGLWVSGLTSAYCWWPPALWPVHTQTHRTLNWTPGCTAERRKRRLYVTLLVFKYSVTFLMIFKLCCCFFLVVVVVLGGKQMGLSTTVLYSVFSRIRQSNHFHVQLSPEQTAGCFSENTSVTEISPDVQTLLESYETRQFSSGQNWRAISPRAPSGNFQRITHTLPVKDKNWNKHSWCATALKLLQVFDIWTWTAQ